MIEINLYLDSVIDAEYDLEGRTIKIFLLFDSFTMHPVFSIKSTVNLNDYKTSSVQEVQ